MFADSLDDLHAFAKRLGLKREWFQAKPRFPHYDLTPSKRPQAVRLGAVEVEHEFAIEFRRKRQEAGQAAPEQVAEESMVKALTICEPYASAIMLPGSDLRAKRVENRKWQTNYRGPLVIHAGLSEEWLDSWSCGPIPEPLHFGKVLGLVDLVACLPIARIRNSAPLGQYEWIRTHPHTEGPWCWVLERPRRLVEPFDHRGVQGLWAIPKKLFAGRQWAAGGAG
jgi:hypothetical protein